jgi:hypothetical protein
LPLDAVLLAMQKVEGSSPFSRFTKAPQIPRFSRSLAARLDIFARPEGDQA